MLSDIDESELQWNIKKRWCISFLVNKGEVHGEWNRVFENLKRKIKLYRRRFLTGSLLYKI